MLNSRDTYHTHTCHVAFWVDVWHTRFNEWAKKEPKIWIWIRNTCFLLHENTHTMHSRSVFVQTSIHLAQSFVYLRLLLLHTVNSFVSLFLCLLCDKYSYIIFWCCWSHASLFSSFWRMFLPLIMRWNAIISTLSSILKKRILFELCVVPKWESESEKNFSCVYRISCTWRMNLLSSVRLFSPSWICWQRQMRHTTKYVEIPTHKENW